MQKQKSYNFPKFIMIVAIIIFIGTLFGAVGYLVKVNNQSEIQRINKEKLSDEVDNHINFAETEFVKFDSELIDINNDGIEENIETYSLKDFSQGYVSVSSWDKTGYKEIGKIEAGKYLEICNSNFPIIEKEMEMNDIDINKAGGLFLCSLEKGGIAGRISYKILVVDFDSRELNWMKFRGKEKIERIGYVGRGEVYENEKYSFRFNFGDAWENTSYLVEEKENIVSFNLKLKEPIFLKNGTKKEYDSLFDIKIISIDEWRKIKPEQEKYNIYYLGANDDSVYNICARNFDESSALFSDFSKSLHSDIEYNILPSFEFIEKDEALLYKYDWSSENCTSFIKNGGFGLSASNKQACIKWIDFTDEDLYYKFDADESLVDYFCDKNNDICSKYYFGSLSGHNGLLNCEIIEHNAGYENVLRSGYICYREPCGVMCGDAPPIESCKFRDVFIAYTENVEFPIVAIGQNWGENCISDADVKEINGLDFHFKHSEIDILMQKRLKECKTKNKNIVSEFNDYIKKFDLNSKEISTDCPDFVEDIDSNTYNTVKIGEQCWMKENLKVTKNPEGEKIVRYCYDDDESICETDGGLYDWNTVMNGSTEEGAQGICPDGWHVPKDSEWYVLENGLTTDTCVNKRGEAHGGGQADDCFPVGMILKKEGSSGFEGILAGYRMIYQGNVVIFRAQNLKSLFWSSSVENGGSWVRSLKSYNSTITRQRLNNTTHGLSLRCLKN